MPEYLAPGVYIEEIELGPRPIEGVPTSTAAFIGETERGSAWPQLVTSYIEYRRSFGDTAVTIDTCRTRSTGFSRTAANARSYAESSARAPLRQRACLATSRFVPSVPAHGATGSG